MKVAEIYPRTKKHSPRMFFAHCGALSCWSRPVFAPKLKLHQPEAGAALVWSECNYRTWKNPVISMVCKQSQEVIIPNKSKSGAQNQWAPLFSISWKKDTTSFIHVVMTGLLLVFSKIKRSPTKRTNQIIVYIQIPRFTERTVSVIILSSLKLSCKSTSDNRSL